ncbi:recombination mediator RecR [Pedobacter alpinus]|uniref:Recombination protein RecR n=1 Tax=Pedobacter alpinus TaxID=1590643 RepID=A0ABW5TWF8_9SPHI
MNFSSKLLENAVTEFGKLPGIGQKTALRLVLHLLNQEHSQVSKFTESITVLKNNIKFCKNCHHISDAELCEICTSHKRDQSIICVVEDSRDIMAIENTHQYNGLYHVLNGLISPMDGVGPADLTIAQLVNRAENTDVKEIIFALSATMEGDTTIFYLNKKLNTENIKISTLARGIAFGGEIEYADELTLGRSITTRVPYQNSLTK